MIDPALVRDRLSEVEARLRTRGLDQAQELAVLSSLESDRRRLIPAVEQLKQEQNAAGEAIARAKKEGQDASAILAGNKVRAAQIRILEADLLAVEQKRDALLLTLPNLPHESVPIGKSSADNVEVHRWGTPPAFDFAPKSHLELGIALGIVDFDRAVRMAGTRFAILSGAGARLERALINFMLDLHTREHGYREMEPPFLVNTKALTGTGNLPKFEQDLFKIGGDWDLYLIPTAEVPLTNLHREEILDGRTLPLKYTAYTPCFRSEAGSYGADVRGLIRQHQFDKVELVKFTTPDQSHDELEKLTRDAETVLEQLGLAYRRVIAVYGRHGLRLGQDVRHRSVAAESGDVSRDFVLQQLRSVPGTTRGNQVPPGRHGQGPARAHAERLRPRRRPHAHRHRRELSAEGRIDRDSRGAAAVRGNGQDKVSVKLRTSNFKLRTFEQRHA